MKPATLPYTLFAWLTSVSTGPVFWLCLRWAGEASPLLFSTYYSNALIAGGLISLPALLIFIGISHLILKGSHSPNEARTLVSLAGLPLLFLTLCLAYGISYEALSGFDVIRLSSAYGLPLLMSIWFYPFD